jgi:hypothetical protein
MAIDAGDVVITFLGDTTQLDQTFDQVTGKVSAASEEAAASTVNLKAAQAELRVALEAVTAEGGNTAENMERLAQAEANLVTATQANTEAQAALRAEMTETSAVEELLTDTTAELTSTLTGMLGVMAMVETIKGFIESTQESILELRQFAQITGVNIQTMAGLEHAADSVGVKFQAVGTGIERLGKAQVAAAEGGKAQQAAFERIGITVDQLKSMNVADLFFEVGGALGNATNSAEALASAQTLLGRGGAQLIPLFQQHNEDLKEFVTEAGLASGVTDQAGNAAAEWRAQMANLHETIRSLVIPALETLIPIIKWMEEGGSVAASVIRTLASSIGALFLSVLDGVSAAAKAMGDTLMGNFKQAIADAKAGGEQIKADWGGAAMQVQQTWENSAKFIAEVWKDVKPLDDAKKDHTDLQGKAKDTSKVLIEEAKKAADAQIAATELWKAQQKLAYDEGKINAEQWAQAETKAANDARDAHMKYLTDVVAIYKAAGDAQKAKIAQDELDIQRVKDSTAVTNELAKSTEDLTKANKAFDAASDKTWKDSQKNIATVSDAVAQMNKNPPFTQALKNVLQLNEDLKRLGIEGVGPIEAKLDLIQKTEQRLNQAGITSGKLWLQVQEQKLKAIIAIDEAEGRSATKEIHDLQQVEHALKDLGQTVKDSVPTMQDQMQKMSQAAGTFASDMGKAFAAVVAGQESMAQAMEQSVGKLIANLANTWAQYFMAMAIADMFFNPARAAAELAAAAALEMLGALAGSLGGGGGAKTSASGSSTVKIPSNTATQGTVGTTAVVNVPRFQAGGLVTAPTIAMIGEFGGNRQPEGVIPLGNPQALTMIGKAIADHLPQASSQAVTITLETDISQTIKRINTATSTGRARLLATDSMRVTRRSV